MSSDNIDLDFLLGRKTNDREDDTEETSENTFDVIYDFHEPVDESELADLSLILEENSPTDQAAERPDKDQTEEVDPQEDQETAEDNAEPFFDINEEALNLSEEIRAASGTNDRDEPEFDAEESEAEFDFDLTDQPLESDEETGQAQELEFEGVPEEIEEPLILPQEPDTDSPESENRVLTESTFDEEFDDQEQDTGFQIDDFEVESDDGDEQKGVSETAPPAHEAKSQPDVETDTPPPVLPEQVELAESSVRKGGFREKNGEREGTATESKSQKKSRFGSNVSLKSLFESTRSLGLDIGATSVKYVVLQKTVRGWKLLNCGIRPLPQAQIDADDDERRMAIQEAIQTNLKIGSFKDVTINTAVSGLEVVYQNIQLPAKARKELPKAVPWACRKDFPFPIESAIFEYQVLENRDKGDDQLDIFVVAAQKELIFQHLDLLQQAKITPAKTSTVPVALSNVFSLAEKQHTDDCYAIIDIGATSSHMVFINQGQLQYARQISTAGNDFTEALVGSIFIHGKEISIERDRAEEIKRKYGFLEKSDDKQTEEGIPLKEISVMMGPVLERMVKEIGRTIDFFKEKFNVHSLEMMYVTGGGSYLKLLTSKLENELNCKTDVLDPFDHISIDRITNQSDLEQVGYRFATAVGLALDRERGLNLLPQGVKGQHKAHYAKKLFRYVSIIIVLILILLSTNIREQVKKVENEFNRIHAEYVAVKPRRDKFLDLQKQLQALQNTKELYASQLEINGAVSNHFKAISHLIPRNIALTSFRMHYRELHNQESGETYIEEVLKLEGVAFQNRSLEGINLAKFLLALEESNYFYQIALKHQRITEEGNLRFSIECVI